MILFKPGWYLLYTRPKHEKKVADQLSLMSIHHFLPMVKSLRAWSDRKKYVDAPLFPSYLFVKQEDSSQYFNSLALNGVLHYVRNGKEIARVSETVVHNLQLVISNPFNEITVSAEHILPGEKLLVQEGPFTGFNCEMIRQNGRRKVLVRIDLIGRNLIVDMPLENILPASAAISVHA